MRKILIFVIPALLLACSSDLAPASRDATVAADGASSDAPGSDAVDTPIAPRDAGLDADAADAAIDAG